MNRTDQAREVTEAFRQWEDVSYQQRLLAMRLANNPQVERVVIRDQAGSWKWPDLKKMRIQLTTMFLFAAMLSLAQTNNGDSANHSVDISNSPAGKFQSQTNPSPTVSQRLGEIRTDLIQNRRLICGKILQVLPEGLVVESGYTNLLQRPLGRSWLVPGTVVASRAPNLVEGKEPESICASLVFLTDYPKSRRAIPKPFDYVILAGYPAGQYTYTSVGALQRTVRRFSASLQEAVSLNFYAVTDEAPARAAGVK